MFKYADNGMTPGVFQKVVREADHPKDRAIEVLPVGPNTSGHSYIRRDSEVYREELGPEEFLEKVYGHSSIEDWPSLEDALSWLEENPRFPGKEEVAEAVANGEDPLEALRTFYAESGIDQEVEFA